MKRAAGVILFRESREGPRFLLLRNALHGTWGFPKGHALAGESLEACAAREVREETGGLPYALLPGFSATIRYPVELPERPGRPGRYRKEVCYFLGRAGEGELRISEEHRDSGWLPAEEAMALLEHPGSRSVLQAALDFLAGRSGDP
ncbi:MAG: bis(5'-nucleosyl)-tetraphosphatase [Planctomycetota bacterium]